MILKGTKVSGEISAIFFHSGETSFERPLFSSLLKAGFPSPAEDYVEAMIDLNRDLVRNPDFTFYATVSGDSMEPLIHNGAMAVYDTSLEVYNGCLVVAVIDGDFCAKWFRKDNFGARLESENPDYAPIVLHEGMDFRICGRIIHAIHSF